MEELLVPLILGRSENPPERLGVDGKSDMYKVTVIGLLHNTMKRLTYIVSDSKSRGDACRSALSRGDACRSALKDAESLGLKRLYVEDALRHVPGTVDLVRVEDA